MTDDPRLAPGLTGTWEGPALAALEVGDADPAALRAVLATEAARGLRALRFDAKTAPDAAFVALDGVWPAVTSVAVDAWRPGSRVRVRRDLGSLAPVFRAFPALRELRVRAGAPRLDAPTHGALEALEIEGIDVDPALLAGASLPRLSRLDLSFGAWGARAVDGPDELGADALLRSLAALPALRDLALRAAGFGDPLCEGLAGGPLPERLDRLVLAGVGLTDRGADALLALAPRLGHLTGLHLGGNHVSADRLAALAARVPALDPGEQGPLEDAFTGGEEPGPAGPRRRA